MTAPDRYDRRDPCEVCGEPVCVCEETWPEDDDLDSSEDVAIDWDVDPADYGLRAVRDLRVRGELL